MKPDNRYTAIGNNGRSSVFGLALFVILFPLGFPAQAQQLGKAYRIGYLGPSSVNVNFVQRLRELGYVEGAVTRHNIRCIGAALLNMSIKS